MHDHNSEVLRRGREQLRQINLIEALGFYDAVDALAGQISLMNDRKQAGGNEEAERCRQKVNEIGATLANEAASSFSPESVRYAMGHGGRALEIVGAQGAAAALEQTGSGRKELIGARLRYDDLGRAAGPAGQSETIAGRAKKQGFVDVTLEPVNHNGTVLIGQKLTMRRPKGG